MQIPKCFLDFLHHGEAASALNSGLLRRSLRLFLPISGAITLVLPPMVILYEQSRRATFEGRVSALVQAATVRVPLTFQPAQSTTRALHTVQVILALALLLSCTRLTPSCWGW